MTLRELKEVLNKFPDSDLDLQIVNIAGYYFRVDKVEKIPETASAGGSIPYIVLKDYSQ